MRFPLASILALIASRVAAAPLAPPKLPDVPDPVSPLISDGFQQIGDIVPAVGQDVLRCSKYQIISARGTFEPQEGERQSEDTVDGILKAVPGGKRYELIYPAGVNYAVDPPVGAAALVAHVHMQRARCPKQLFVLTGYSEGAMVVVQALNNDALPYDAISGVVLFGSPYWRSWNRESAGSATVGAGVASYVISTPRSYAGKTQDYCMLLDPICSGQPGATHVNYEGSPEQAAAIGFAAQQLRETLSS